MKAITSTIDFILQTGALYSFVLLIRAEELVLWQAMIISALIVFVIRVTLYSSEQGGNNR